MRAVGWPGGGDPREEATQTEKQRRKTLAAERDGLSSVGF